MTTKSLKAFIVENDIETRKSYTGQAMLWLPPYLMEDFIALIKPEWASMGIESYIQKDFICIYMNDVCGLHGVNIDELFKAD